MSGGGRAEDAKRIVLSGDVDLATAPALQHQLLEVVQRQPDADVVVDLNAVTFIDVTSIGLLAGAAERLRRQGGRLQVVSAHDAQVRVFQAAGLAGLLEPPA